MAAQALPRVPGLPAGGGGGRGRAGKKQLSLIDALSDY